jgi:hypothetical protein
MVLVLFPAAAAAFSDILNKAEPPDEFKILLVPPKTFYNVDRIMFFLLLAVQHWLSE